MKTTTPGSRHRSVRFILGFLAIALLVSRGDDSRAVVEAQGASCDIVCGDEKTEDASTDLSFVAAGDAAGNGVAADVGVNVERASGDLDSSSSASQVTPPNPAAGAPVLIVTSASNPFTTYYTEILRTEGFNLFRTADISTVVPDTLAGYDVVILGEMPLTAGQVAMFTDWVTAGGNLVAMRPDKQLYGLLGLVDLGTSLSNGYLKIRSDSGVPTAGIINETIQFHGDADLTALDGAAPVATLYAGADNESATESPAITLRGVGVAGGQAAAFLYDLARSVVLTRQGNPAWSGQNRDLIDPIRSNDLFYGPADFDPQPDWVNLNKVHIPQADEQQRLLANAILSMTQDRKPLPRFWYFPRSEKAVVVMTGDAHGLETSTARLNELNAASAAGCSLNDWDCLRGTAYIYPNTLTLFDGGPGGVASYIAQGHEIALHTNTDCQNYTAASLDQTLTTQLAELAQKYPSIPAPRTNRTHCIVWSDYTSQAEVELRHGIRFDTTYYYWPGSWVENRPGFMGGSGMPMRFAKSTGETIDVYQDVTEFIDEDNSSHTFPFFADALLDRAIGPEGYYGVFTANMHGDGGNNSNVKQAQIVASAKAHSVPVVSAAQMLDWLDGRNNSSFGSLTWNGTTELSFTVTNAPGANGLRGMLPAFGSGTPTEITRDGLPIGFTLETIKGVTYALFDATTGSYQATYGPDTTAAAISNVRAKPLTSSTAMITWSTNEAATTRVDYGTRDTSLNLFANDDTQVNNHALTLTGLLPETKYYYRVTSVDFFGNHSTFPAATEAALTFTTMPLVQSFTDTTAADFGAGTPDGATLVAQTADGEVILKPTDGSEFFGSTLASNWTSGVWGADGSVTVNAGRLQLNNGWARTTAEYGPGHSLEFVATFGPDAFQHSGFGRNFNGNEPWAIFSTSATTGQLFARTKPATGGETSVAIAGNWIGSPHRFRIDWNAQDVVYFIDGTQVARHLVQIAAPMQMLAASDFDSDSAFGTNPFSLTLDWERMSPYPSSGQYFSRIIDAGAAVNWYNVAWTQGAPGVTAVAIDVRAGDSPTPDGSWSGFVPVSEPGAPITGLSARRYLQYRATLTTTNPHFSPELRSVTVNHAVGAPNTAPTAQDDDAATDEDTPYRFPAIGAGSLTANDSDVETPAALTVIAVGNPTNGTVTLNLDGSVTFAPLANVSGVGAFTYSVSDGALSDDGIVTITINAVNDVPVGIADPSAAPGSFYQATEDVALLVPVATGVLANDTDVETTRAALTAQVDTMPAHGALTLNPDGSFLYQPAQNFSGPDGFFYRVSDGTALSAPTGVSILVQGTNDAPIGNDDSFTLSRSGVPITVTSLVRNGSTVTATTTVAHGFATGHSVRIDGAIETDYNGPFTVTATGPRTFSYTVAGTPASPASGTIRATAEDTTRTYAAPGVIANDSDLDGQTLTASLLPGAENSTQNGTLVFNSNGSFTYTPDVDFVGVDTFKYSVSDGNGGSDTATATIAVHGEIAAETVGEGGGTVTTGVTPTIVDPLETTVSTPIAGDVTIEQTAVSADSTAAGYTFLGQQVNITISTINETQPLTDPSRPLLITFTADASLVAAGQTKETLQIFRNGILLFNCPAGPLTISNYPCVSERTALSDGDLQFTVKTLAPSIWNVGTYIALDASMSTPEDAALVGNVSSLSGHPNPGSLTFGTETEPVNGTLELKANGAFTYTPAPNFSGEDRFRFSVSDGKGGTGSASVFVTVTPVNDAPKADPQSLAFDEDTAATITLTGSDVENAALSFTIVSPPRHGRLTGEAPNVMYRPDADYMGSDSFTFTTRDGALNSEPAIVSITVNPVNDAPLAVSQTINVNEDNGTAITLTGTDVDSASLSFVVISEPAHGRLTGTAPALSYIPAPDYNGSDSFTFRASDGAQTSAAATVTINVAPVNDHPTASGDSLTVEEDSGSAPLNVVANDTAAPDMGETLTISTKTDGANGTVAIAAGGALTYTPNHNFNGTDTFTYTISDGNGGSASATVTVTVTPVNDAPIAESQTVVTDEDSIRDITLVASDVDGGTLTYIIVAAPTKGTLSGTAPSLAYTPNSNANGSDSFTFKVRDDANPARESNVATVDVTVSAVNDAPTAADDSFSTNEDTPLTVAAPGVLAGDSDVEGNALTAVLVSGPTSGTLTLNANGSFSFTPASNATGNVSFSYRASDGTSNSNTATVTITLNAVNDAPIATDNSFSTNEDTPLSVAAPGVLAGDSDVEGNTLTAELVSGPSSGTLTLNANGSFSYTPAANATGNVTFTYRASDGTSNSNTATVTITLNALNDAPIATDNSFSTNEDTPLTVAAPGVLAGDSDVEGNALTAVLVSGPSSGTLTLNANGSFSYTPAAHSDGTDSFTYRASDGALQSGLATVTITVTPVNDAPTAANDSFSTNEDTVLTVAAPGVLAGDSDVEGNPLTAVLVNAVDPAKGTLTLNPNGSFSFTPALNLTGNVTFTYRANDGTSNSNIATVTVAVTPVNDAPAATAQSVSTTEDAARPITLSAADADGNPLTYNIVAGPANGTLTGAAPNMTYTPTANFNGTDSFTFKANDGTADSAPATVTITVSAVNDAPTVSDIANQTTGGTAVSANFVVGDVESLATLNLTGQSSNTTLVPNASIVFGGSGANRSVTVTPAAGQSGSATITVIVSDGSSTASDAFVVTVAASTPSTTSTPTSSAATTTFGQNVTLTTTVSGAGGTPTGNVEFFDNGISLGTATLSGGTASLTTNKIAAGTRSITASYLGNAQFAASTSGARTQTVNKATATPTFSTTPFSMQYSDLLTFKATVSPATIGGVPPATTARFKVGTQVMGTAPLVLNPTTGLLEALLTTQLLETVAGQTAIGSRVVAVEFVDVNPSVTLANRTASLGIKAEDARTAYVGPATVAVCASCSTATIRLETEVTELADGNLGDIRKSTVTFINRATGAIIGAATLDATKSTATKAYYYYNWNVTVTGASQAFTIGTSVTGYYTRNATTENGTTTVVKQ